MLLAENKLTKQMTNFFKKVIGETDIRKEIQVRSAAKIDYLLSVRLILALIFTTPQILIHIN